jgi:hypothetical protein
MAELNHTVDPNQTEQNFDPIPAGEYFAVIESSNRKETNNSTGEMLVLCYQIIDGNFKGRKIFNNLMLEYKDDYLNSLPEDEKKKKTQSLQIASNVLNSIGVATGIQTIKDSSQIHNIPIKINVGVKEDPVYGKQNTIKTHTAMGKSVPESTPNSNSTQEAEAVSAAPGDRKKPWE